MFELAVLELKEAEAAELQGLEQPSLLQEKWKKALKLAGSYLDRAMSLATNSTDLSSRLDMRVSMLRDEIATKQELLGIR